MDKKILTAEEVLEDACTVAWIAYNKENPQESLHKLISFNCQIMLDPSVSYDARMLYEKGRADMLRELTDGTLVVR